ncbi:hypothetical protein M441DRAFT_150054 [Trichoderma asperellum CBS 433.97]|uniref:Uncharacterized protein n=1 Tax=Trichoderma asperellum (strain ATCC 204424 / CBS 433.97 / NBRC 101777) TaxID=1042311 RepID=A0A2T3YVX5_TRIA4|nr:hypothetical protein M441DRAFT_150054 [Trichoderma asperellum CBS 433.97]PTB36719.1 hypothetical protein M441DRAFT_150054 [Trichoderma asperellum CBS 433.97]
MSRFRTHGRGRSNEEWRSNEPQCIPGGYIVPRRLEAALKEKWPNQYVVEMRSNEYRVRAPGKLTDEEISTCYSYGY